MFLLVSTEFLKTFGTKFRNIVKNINKLWVFLQALHNVATKNRKNIGYIIDIQYFSGLSCVTTQYANMVIRTWPRVWASL